MSLFHLGKELFDRFGLSLESEITYSDYCSEPISLYSDRIKFTSKSLIFVRPKNGLLEHIDDDWIETEELDLHPWNSVLSFQNLNRGRIKQKFGKTEIQKWLSTIKDPHIDYPHIDVRPGHIAFIVTGKPKSIRVNGLLKVSHFRS